MNPAFADFREPHAWLLRGLVEYGWPDVTRVGGRVPPGTFGGLELSRLPNHQAREGLNLVVPAIADGRWLQEDGTYTFGVRLTRDEHGTFQFVVRSPEANYLKQFPFDLHNPLHAAGYIQQDLQAYVREFVLWRLDGGELTWAQRAGMPDIQGEPCSSQLARFLSDRIQARQSLDAGPAEGWWLPGFRPAAPQAPIAALGRAAENERGQDGELQVASRAQLERTASGPGGALLFLSTVGMVEGGLWLLNILLTGGLLGAGALKGEVSRYLFSFVFSFGAGTFLLIGGGIGIMGARHYQRLRRGVLPWLSMLYVACSPLCCMFGVPVAIWSAVVWQRIAQDVAALPDKKGG